MKKKLIKSPVRYSFDKVEYSSKSDISVIRSLVKMKEFKELFSGKVIRQKARGVRSIKYNSLFGGRPNVEANGFFASMDCNLYGIGGTLTYIEVAKDIYHHNEVSAISAYEKLKKNIFLKYGRDNCCIMKWNGELTNGCFYEEAVYLGNYRKFQFVVYPRYCKATNKPVLRMEFRIAINRNILSRIGVEHERFIPNAKECYLKLKKKYLRYGFINRNKIESLLRCRSKYTNILDVYAFQKFRNDENRRDLSGECLEYKQKLKRPVMYYIE